MEEPPLKRAKRTDDHVDSRPSSGGRDVKPRSRYDGDRDEGRRHKREDGRRNTSRPRDTPNKRRERSRSRERSHRGRDGGARERNVNGDSHRERSRSQERYKPSKDQKSQRPRKHSRSRSPVRDGANGSIRTRSPPRRSDNDRGRIREPAKAEDARSTHNTKRGAAGSSQSAVNGDRMAVDEDDEDALLRNMMGFTTFKSTQNTKVPGNQIYGVRKEKKTEYRQYMNRVGGFNRPLSPSRS
ncbi:hypothetical protein RBB50_002368 [Rhinocladiella similis]